MGQQGCQLEASTCPPGCSNLLPAGEGCPPPDSNSRYSTESSCPHPATAYSLQPVTRNKMVWIFCPRLNKYSSAILNSSKFSAQNSVCGKIFVFFKWAADSESELQNLQQLKSSPITAAPWYHLTSFMSGSLQVESLIPFLQWRVWCIKEKNLFSLY